MTTVRALVAALASGAARPRLTWYGPDADRVDLSGRVLANWVVKAANLLLEEADAGPGTTVVLDLPAHWRTVVWAMATWVTGGTVVVPGTSAAEEPAGDVVVTVRARPSATGALVVAVALPALARVFPGDLPAGAVDGSAELMGRSDALGPLRPVDPASLALDSDGVRVPHGSLVEYAASAGGGGWPAVPRVLWTPRGTRTTGTVEAALVTSLAAWSAGGSVVLVADAEADVERIAAAERVTAGG